MGNFFLRFGDVSSLDPPNIVHGVLSFENFSNPIDLTRVNQAMDEEIISQTTTFMDEYFSHHDKKKKKKTILMGMI